MNDGPFISIECQKAADGWQHPPSPEGFRITDDASANWLIRRIVECRAYAQRCAEWCEREQVRARREEESLLHRYGPQLMDYVRQRIETAGGRRKSLSLPAGVAGFRRTPARLVVDDEAAVIAWANEHHPQLLRTLQRLRRPAFHEHIQQTGEVPEVGVHIEPEREKFYIK